MFLFFSFLFFHRQTFGGPADLKFWRETNVQNSARFRTTSDFDREYHRDG